MNNQLLFGVVVVPAVIGLVEVLKQAGLPSKFAPIAAVSFGILAGFAQLEAGKLPWIPAVVIGVSLGLSAVGLYSGISSVSANFTQKPPTTTTTPTPSH